MRIKKPKSEPLWITVLAAVIALTCQIFPKTAYGQEKSLLVGISPHTPFVILSEDQPQGFSIDLWEAIAEKLGKDYHFIKSKQITGVLEDLMENRVDIAIGGVAVTKDREHLVDFTHSFFMAGLGILVEKRKNISPISLVRSVFKRNKLIAIAGFCVFLVIMGHLIWFMERHQPEDIRSFPERYLPGIFEGMYWVVVTASTVGYGDRVPRSWAGRILAVMLIIIALPLFALFIAKLSSDITLYELHSNISRPQDLIEKRVGVIQGTTSHEYVIRMNTIVTTFDNIETAYTWLMKGRLDAVVYDRPNLQYFAKNRGKGKVEVVGNTFAPQDYAIATPQGSEYREKLNRIILSLIESGEVEAIRNKWFGLD